MFTTITNLVLFTKNNVPIYKNHKWEKTDENKISDQDIYRRYNCSECGAYLVVDHYKGKTTISTNFADMKCEDVLIQDIIE